MDQDNKIREYVMKKQQQRDRAQMLRAQRRNQTGSTNGMNRGQQSDVPNYGRSGSFSSQKRIIGDPFAPVSQSFTQNVQNENIDTTNASQYRNNNGGNNDRTDRYGNDNRYDTYNNNGDGNYNHNNNNGGNNNRSDRYDNPTPFGKMPRNNNDRFSENGLNQNRNTNRHQSRNNLNNAQNSKNAIANNTNHIKHEYNDHNSYNNQNKQNNWQTPMNNKSFRNTKINNDSHSNYGQTQRVANNQNNGTNIRDKSVSNENANESNNTYATAGDVKKVVSMVEQLRGQMHALQFQIDNVKMENVKLKEQIIKLEKEKAMQSQQSQQMNEQNLRNHRNDSNNLQKTHNNQSNQYYQSRQSNAMNNNNSRKFNMNNNNNFHFQKPPSKMDIDHQSHNGNNNTHNTRNTHNKSNNNWQSPMNNNSIRNMNGSHSHPFGNNNSIRNNNYTNALNNSMMNANANASETDNEMSALPISTAADILANLDKAEGAFVDESAIERIECRQCGRKFGRSALERHIKICKKVFGQKRKQFNVKQQRVDSETMNATANTNTAHIEAELKRKKEQSKKNWKSQSNMLRQAMKASKQIELALKSGKSLADIPNMPSQVPDNRVPCPHCGRKFAEETAKRHIPKCQNIKARPKALKRRR